MANIQFSGGTGNTNPATGQQYVLTKEGLQGLAGSVFTAVKGETDNNGNAWESGAKYITLYRGDATHVSVPVGSAIEFANATSTLPATQDKGTFRVTIDGTTYEVPLKGITNTAVGSSEDPFTNGYFTNLYVDGHKVAPTMLPTSISTTGMFWRGDGTWSNTLAHATEQQSLRLSGGPYVKGTSPAPTTNTQVAAIYLQGKDASGATVQQSLGRLVTSINGQITQTTIDAIINTAGEGTRTSLSLIYDNSASGGNTSFSTYKKRILADDAAFLANKVFNAVFNDYAEYRTTINLEPGRVVVDQDDGSLVCASARLQPGAQVISDTFGHSMGETDTAKTPLAVAGRVLVYPYQARENYHAGMAVCSAPDGTVDIMTREEIRDYPDCIVGIVSEIPQYETWGSDNVKVDGRIWVRIK